MRPSTGRFMQLLKKSAVPKSAQHRVIPPLGHPSVTPTQVTLVHQLTGGQTPEWRSLDPVWWRNALGYSIWVVIADAMSLWYEWLSMKEVRTRRVADRTFAGVDPRELDLLDGARRRFI